MTAIERDPRDSRLRYTRKCLYESFLQFLEEKPVSDITVIEGVMGFYDGISVSDEASAWDVARATDTPVVLVVDGRGRARSIAAEVLGFMRLREPSNIAGVILNRVSPSLYPRLAELVESECGVRVYGYLPKLDDCSLESRHLGLVTADEVVDLREKLDKLADTMATTVDIDGLLGLAKSAPPLYTSGSEGAGLADASPKVRSVRIAVARDVAFCFYYADSLRLLEKLGAELVEFSPLHDATLPEGVAGIYLGGGYPELHARELSENEPMLASIRAAIEAGMPTVAECGGFLYLHEQLEDEKGASWPLVGIVPARAFRTPKLGRFGYVTLAAKHDGLLAAEGETLRAHEFHYWDSEAPGDAFSAQKPQSARGWECCISTPTLHAGFPHLYFPGSPEAARRFVEACEAWAAAHVQEISEGGRS